MKKMKRGVTETDVGVLPAVAGAASDDMEMARRILEDELAYCERMKKYMPDSFTKCIRESLTSISSLIESSESDSDRISSSLTKIADDIIGIKMWRCSYSRYDWGESNSRVMAAAQKLIHAHENLFGKGPELSMGWLGSAYPLSD